MSIPIRPSRRLPRLLGGCLAGLLVAGPAPAATISGVAFPEQIESEDGVLQLQGAALLRYRIVCLERLERELLGAGR